MDVLNLIHQSPFKKCWISKLSGVNRWNLSMFINGHRELNENQEIDLKNVFFEQKWFNHQDVIDAFEETKKAIKFNNSNKKIY
jgi:hypothetical protein